MKLRTVALALVLGLGLTAASEAKYKQPRSKHPVHKVQNHNSTSRARLVKPRKYKRPAGQH